MALAIVVLLIGIPIGLFMLFRPKTVWWTFESWKYKNPEANEPSDTSYALSALSGLGVIAAAVILAVLAWTKPGPADYRSTSTMSPHVYSPPPPPPVPQNRGEIPVVAYQIEELPASGGKPYLEVSYLVPDNSNATAGSINSEPRDGCEIMQTVTGLGTDHVTVDLHLSWVNRNGYYNGSDDAGCRITGKWSPYVSTMVISEIRPGTTVLTNGTVVDQSGKVLAPAAPGNPVPNLYCTVGGGCRRE